MLPRRAGLVAILVLLGLVVATLQEWFIHTDDGCVIETHCNACLLRLGTPGVPAAAFALARLAAGVDCVVSPPVPSPREASPRRALSRGPPAA